MTSPSITLVTCLYNINRETKGDGRKWSDYLEWFGKTLLLQENMVIFIDKSLETFVKEKRSSLKEKTKIVIRPFTELPCYKYLDQIKLIIDDFKKNNPKDLSLRLPEYEVVIHSKAGLILECMQHNHFNSSLFAWVDAGVSRFWKKVDHTKEWPHSDYRRIIETSNRVWIQPMPYIKKRYSGKDIGFSQARVFATVFIGNVNSMTVLCDLLNHFLQEKMLKRNRIDNEQVSMSIIGTKYKSLFQYVCQYKPGWWSFVFKSHHLVLSDIFSQPFDNKMSFAPKP